MSKQNCRIGRRYSRTVNLTPFGENTSMRLEIIDMAQSSVNVQRVSNIYQGKGITRVLK